MGTYDQLMKLNQPDKAKSPGPAPASRRAASSPNLASKSSASSPATPPPQQVQGSVSGSAKQPAATVTPRHHDTTASRYHATIIEAIRAAVKEFGKEAATHRFTSDEKEAVADIIYGHKKMGIKTSENEIARIAINFLVADYRENGKASVLSKVLNALNR